MSDIKTILQIDSSPLGDRSTTRKLTAQTVAELQSRYPGAKLITHDYGTTPLPHLSATTIGAFFTPAEQRDARLAEAIKLSDQATDELIAADIVVIGVPMWNFGIPSALKAWVDHIARAGRTFKYTATGPEGLLSPDKKVIIVSSRGGVYSTGPMQSMDHQETYLKSVFGFLGVKDLTFIRAEGMAMGEEPARQAMRAAQADLTRTVETLHA